MRQVSHIQMLRDEDDSTVASRDLNVIRDPTFPANHQFTLVLNNLSLIQFEITALALIVRIPHLQFYS